MVDAQPADLTRDRADVLRAMNASALDAKVGPARKSLVEETTRGNAIQRQQMEIREVRDPHRISAAQRNPTSAGRGSSVRPRAAARSHIDASWYEPPRTTWKPPPATLGFGLISASSA